MGDNVEELVKETLGEVTSTIQLCPIEIQQLYFENLFDCDWIKYEKKDRNLLFQNIAFALFGSPSSEGELREIGNDETAQLVGYTFRQKEEVLKIYEKLCEQSKYSQNDEDIMMSVLLIVCAKPKALKFYQFEPSDYWVDLHIKRDIDIWCTAVFRVRKCIPTTSDAKPCRIYIDESARVYHDWESYLTDNIQPKCVLIVPENGEYTGRILEDEGTFAVNLTVAPSPSLGIKARVLSTVDVASTAASLGAMGIIGASLFTPVGPVVLAGAAVATVTTGLYGLVRSSAHLHDRSAHEQTISPTNPEARGSWLNIAASSVGLAAGAASSLLSRSAAVGTNLTKTGQALAISVDLLRNANIMTGGAGVIHNLTYIINKYRKHGEKPTALEIFQFTSATLFFCNAVMSNKTAQSIVEDAQAKTINEYRTTLRSNRHRKMFDKITAESRRVQGNIQGNTEVIKGIMNIDNKDEYFASVLRINKEVNQHKLRIYMTSDGKVNLNAQLTFDPIELCNMGKEGRTELFRNLRTASTAVANAPTRLISPNAVSSRVAHDEESNSILVNISPNEVIRIGSFLFRISSSSAEIIAAMLEELSQEAYGNLMTVSLNLLSKLVPQEIAKVKILSPEEDLILQTVRFVFNYLRHKRPLGEPSVHMDNPIVVMLKEFFQDGIIRQETILELKDRFINHINEELENQRKRYPHKKQEICLQCRGVRFG